MKKFLFLSLWIASLTSLAQTDDELVRQTVTSAYIDGIHNGGPVENIRRGFHPKFSMLRLMENDIRPLTIEEWITNIEANRAKGVANPAKTEGKFVSVTIAGTSANVVLELSRDSKKIFTDNLLLYKFNEGWRIVSKTFYRHP